MRRGSFHVSTILETWNAVRESMPANSPAKMTIYGWKTKFFGMKESMKEGHSVLRPGETGEGIMVNKSGQRPDLRFWVLGETSATRLSYRRSFPFLCAVFDFIEPGGLSLTPLSAGQRLRSSSRVGGGCSCSMTIRIGQRVYFPAAQKPICRPFDFKSRARV
jgi:hypothetical protein